MIWNYTYTYSVPEGYTLVETDKHKKERLQYKKDHLKAIIEMCENKLVEAEKELKTVKEELKKLE